MTPEQFLSKQNPKVQNKVKSGAAIIVKSVGKNEDGATVKDPQLTRDGEPALRVIAPGDLKVFQQFGWEKVTISKPPVSATFGDPGEKPTRTRRKKAE